MTVYRHIYNRGAHKTEIFKDANDYIRMVKLLYIANNTRPFVMSSLPQNVFCVEKDETLVDIVAYCLMPNHIHIAIKTTENQLITKFMRKLCTAYSCYFNLKYHHSGTIWQGKYKSKEEFDDTNIDVLIKYIHMNPYTLKNKPIELENQLAILEDAVGFAKEYEYSSFKDYLGVPRIQRVLLSIGPTSKRSDLSTLVS